MSEIKFLQVNVMHYIFMEKAMEITAERIDPQCTCDSDELLKKLDFKIFF